MTKCRGQWAEDQPFGTCIQCGGKLSDHETYAAWIQESTYDERRALSFNPPLAIHQPPALLPDAPTDALRIALGMKVRLAKPPLTEREQRNADGVARAVKAMTDNSAIIGSFVMGHR
jgi:hypothetical protein